MAVGVVLNLRYKFKLIESFFPKIYGAQAIEKIARIRKICYDLEEYRSDIRPSGRNDL